jgi:hypothetical protein
MPKMAARPTMVMRARHYIDISCSDAPAWEQRFVTLGVLPIENAHGGRVIDEAHMRLSIYRYGEF